MSLLGFARHIAVFYDKNGDFVGSKQIEWTFSSSIGHTKKTFVYRNGSYNVIPALSRYKLPGTFIPRSRPLGDWNLIFDTYVYTYDIDNPDPIRYQRNEVKPFMSPQNYKDRLESKLITDLNHAYETGLAGLFSFRNIVILLVVIAIFYYFSSGGTIDLPTG